MAKSNFIVRGGADFSGITKEMNKTQAKLKGFQTGISKSFKIVGAALSTLAIGTFIKDSTKMAMGVESATENIGRNMENSAGAFKNWVETQSRALGMGKAEAYKYGSTFSNLLDSFTTDAETTAKETEKLMKAAAIISSKTGRSYDDVSERIRSGMMGSTEAIEDLGVYTQISMIESTDAFKRFANGKTWNQLDFKVQQQIRLAAILEQTYQRYGSTLADTTQTRQAQFIASLKNIQLNIGQAFLPIYNAVLPALTALANKIEQVTSTFAAFTESIFGKAKASQETEQQASAMTDLGNETEKAGKKAKGALAGFDEINALTTKSDSGSTAGASPANEPTLNADDKLVDENKITMLESALNEINNLASKIKDYFTSSFGPSISEAIEKMKEPLQNWKTAIIETFDSFKTFGEPVKQWFLGDFTTGLQTAIQVIGEVIAGSMDTSVKVFTGLRDAIMPILSWLVNDGLSLITQFCTETWKLFGTIFDNVKKIFDTLWAEGIQPGLSLASNIMKDTLDIIKGFWDKWGVQIFDKLKETLNNITNTLLSIWGNILQPLWQKIVDTISWLWEKHLKGLISEIGDFIGKLVTAVLDIWNKFVTPLIDFLVKYLGPHWSNIFQFIVDIVGTAVGVIVDVVKGIIKALGGIVDFIAGVFTGDWKRAWTGIKDFFGGIFDGIVGIFKGAINLIIDGLNFMVRALNTIHFDFPDWVPGLGGKGFGINIPQIPKLAKGGITNGPMVAMIGDNPGGQEVVSPLDKLQNMLAAVVNNSLQSNKESTTNDTLILKVGETEFGRIVLKAIENANRQTGITIMGI